MRFITSIQQMRHFFEYIAAITLVKCLCVIPRSMAFHFGSVLGWCVWSLGIRKKLVLANLAQAFPDATLAEIKIIGRRAAENLGRTSVEFIRYGIKEPHSIHDLVTVQGLDPLKQALARGNGAIVLTGHYAAWVAYFAAISTHGIPLSLLVGKQHNQRIDQLILKIPGDWVEFITKGRAAVKKILLKLNEGHAVVMTADQHAGRGVVVPFLGKEASTLPLPGSFAAKYHTPLFFMWGYRKDDGTHQVEIKELTYELKDSEEETKKEVLTRYNEEMGRVILEKPEQYFWYHRRWRDGYNKKPKRSPQKHKKTP